MLLNGGGIFHGACRLYSCSYTPVWCLSFSQQHECWLMFGLYGTMCLRYFSTELLPKASSRPVHLQSYQPECDTCSSSYQIIFSFCFVFSNDESVLIDLFFISVQLPNVPSVSPSIMSSGNLISMLCFLTQITIEISSGTESRTDSCRTPSIHPFILTANPDNSLYSVF